MNGGETSRLERWMGIALRTGALASGALLAVGLLLELAGVNHGLAAAVTGAGLMILMATPVARVVVSVVEFALDRDWVFLVMTAGVLIILMGSLGVAVGKL